MYSIKHITGGYRINNKLMSGLPENRKQIFAIADILTFTGVLLYGKSIKVEE